MTTVEVLKQVSDLLRNSHHWTQGALARNAKDQPCPTDSAAAVRFSLAGAIDRTVALADEHGLEMPTTRVLGDMLARRLGHSLPHNSDGDKIALELVMAFNDIADHRAIVGLLDDATCKVH